MKITFDWLRDHLKTNSKEKDLLEQLTNIGLEVESVENLSADNELFKIAKIVKTEKHPNADRLKVCDVNIGEKNLKKVVCGATNAKDGLITIQPLNAEPGQEIIVGQIGTTRGTENLKLVKSLDGYIRTEDGGIPEPDQLSTIVAGFLESSNVKSVDQLVAGIEQSRAYEINVKFITTAKELDEAGSSLMRIPN